MYLVKPIYWKVLGALALVLTVMGLLVPAAMAQAQEAATTTDGGLSLNGVFSEIFQDDSEVLFAIMAPGFLVYILSVVLQPSWSPKLKQAVTYVVCFAVAAAFLFFKGDTVWSWDGAPRLFIIVAAVARGYYQMYKSPIKDVETTTSLTGNAKG